MQDVNALYHAPTAINTMLVAGLISKRAAAKAKAELSKKLNDAIEYYSEKGFFDVVDGLNSAWRSIQ